jgi:hypothetical protein
MQVRECLSAQSAEASDGVLVGRALAGDERAFETLVRRYHGLLFASTYRYMRDDDQACFKYSHSREERSQTRCYWYRKSGIRVHICSHNSSNTLWIRSTPVICSVC